MRGRVVGDDLRGVVSVYSLSKQSNLAGYRAGFVAGWDHVVAQLLAVRKHAGLMPPAPVQEAMRAALGDEAHVAVQKERYRARRAALAPALEAAGFRIDRSEAGLYLWATRDEDCWASVDRLAERGVVVQGINYKDRPEDARAWLQELGDPFRLVGADRDGRAAIEWGVYGVPETFVLDREGRIAYRHVGPMQPRDVEAKILPLLEKLK